jgi:hypothetical protein
MRDRTVNAGLMLLAATLSNKMPQWRNSGRLQRLQSSTRFAPDTRSQGRTSACAIVFSVTDARRDGRLKHSTATARRGTARRSVAIAYCAMVTRMCFSELGFYVIFAGESRAPLGAIMLPKNWSSIRGKNALSVLTHTSRSNRMTPRRSDPAAGPMYLERVRSISSCGTRGTGKLFSPWKIRRAEARSGK